MNVTPSAYSAAIRVRRLALDAPPGALLSGLARRAEPVMLDSSALSDEFGRYTILACEPVEVLTGRDGELTDARGRVLARGDEEIWRRLDAAFRCVDVRGDDPTGGGYAPGWSGYLAYELGRHVERLPARAVRDTAFPDLRLAFHDAILVYDALDRSWRLVELVFDDPPVGAGAAAVALTDLVAGAPPRGGFDLPAPPDRADPAAAKAVRAASNFARDDYLAAVARCIDYIAAGDIYQVNLSQRFAIADAPDPAAIHAALRRRNPACYAAYLSFESAGSRCAIASCSPELFLRVRGDEVLTRPIKGTRPRVGDDARDRAAAADLLASPKDNAELAMIVDLLRNDLGRACRLGSVRVVEPRRLETHPTVFHLVAGIAGRLREGAGMAGLLRATFPGGSITGAPKIRSMEIIDELEPFARGAYTGCIGHVGVNGRGEWNIAIRTIVWQDGGAFVQVGGGIVADSTPEGEYAETLDKARAMLEAVAEAHDPRQAAQAAAAGAAATRKGTR